MASSEQTTFFTNKLYDKLKFIALVLLPALGTLWFTLSGIWDLPYVVQVVRTIMAIDAFLGVVLHLTTASYYKNGKNFDGTIDVNDTADKTAFMLNYNGDPDDIPGKHSVEFKVNKTKSTS